MRYIAATLVLPHDLQWSSPSEFSALSAALSNGPPADTDTAAPELLAARGGALSPLQEALCRGAADATLLSPVRSFVHALSLLC